MAIIVKKRAIKHESVNQIYFKHVLEKIVSLRYYRKDFTMPCVPVWINQDKTLTLLTEENVKTILVKDSKEIYRFNAQQMCNLDYGYNDIDSLRITNCSASKIAKTLPLYEELRLSETIKTFAFKSDDSYCFCRLPFDYVTGTPLPERWSNLLGNFTNTEAVCMWIGSLFFPDSDRSQYLWLYGRGGNGKSTLARVISDVLGQFVRYEQAPSSDDKYWTNGLIGKRLIVIDDCNNYGFVKTGLFKSLTGSSKVRVEAKYGTPYDVDLDCKFLFTSNELPMVSSEIADQRRLIFSAAKNSERFEYDANFESDLRSSLGDFVSYCMDQYAAACSDRRPIPVDSSESEELADIFNEEIAAWLDQVGEFDDNSRVSVYDFINALNLTKLNKRHVYKYLETKGVFRSVAAIGNSSVKVLKGFKLKVFNGRF